MGGGGDEGQGRGRGGEGKGPDLALDDVDTVIGDVGCGKELRKFDHQAEEVLGAKDCARGLGRLRPEGRWGWGGGGVLRVINTPARSLGSRNSTRTRSRGITRRGLLQMDGRGRWYVCVFVCVCARERGGGGGGERERERERETERD